MPTCPTSYISGFNATEQKHLEKLTLGVLCIYWNIFCDLLDIQTAVWACDHPADTHLLMKSHPWLYLCICVLLISVWFHQTVLISPSLPSLAVSVCRSSLWQQPDPSAPTASTLTTRSSTTTARPPGKPGASHTHEYCTNTVCTLQPIVKE